MDREIKFEYGFRSQNGVVKKVYNLYEIPNIKEKCDVWGYLPIIYVRQLVGLKIDKREDGFDEYGNYKTKLELCEYDIVEFKRSTAFTLGDEVMGEKYVVIYQAELGGGFVLKHISVYNKQNGCNEIVNGYRAIDPYTMSNLSSHFEIIGSIYENPELLPDWKP